MNHGVTKVSKPTKEDAFVLFQFRREFLTPDLGVAWNCFMDEFKADTYEEFESKYPPGSLERKHVFAILDLYEMAGVLVSHGLLHENL